MVLGAFIPFAYAEGNVLSSAKEGLEKEALNKITTEVLEDL